MGVPDLLCTGAGGGGLLASSANLGIIRANNTPQAYLSTHRHDAQTGGLLISGVGNAL